MRIIRGLFGTGRPPCLGGKQAHGRDGNISNCRKAVSTRTNHHRTGTSALSSGCPGGGVSIRRQLSRKPSVRRTDQISQRWSRRASSTVTRAGGMGGDLLGVFQVRSHSSPDDHLCLRC